MTLLYPSPLVGLHGAYLRVSINSVNLATDDNDIEKMKEPSVLPRMRRNHISVDSPVVVYVRLSSASDN